MRDLREGDLNHYNYPKDTIILKVLEELPSTTMSNEVYPSDLKNYYQIVSQAGQLISEN